MQLSTFTQKLRVSTASTLLVITIGLFSIPSTMAADMSNGANNFYQSTQVTIQKVTFKNLNRTGFVGDFLFKLGHLT